MRYNKEYFDACKKYAPLYRIVFYTTYRTLSHYTRDKILINMIHPSIQVNKEEI